MGERAFVHICLLILAGRLALSLENVADLGKKNFFARRRGGFGRCFFDFLFAPQHIYAPYKHEQRKRNDGEFYHRIDKQTDVEGGHACCLGNRQGRHCNTLWIGQHDEQVGEIHAAEHQPDDRHEYVVDQRGHDRAEGAADNNTHGHVDHVAFDGKFLEFLDE